MAEVVQPIGQYVHSCRTSVFSDENAPLHIVIGNEAADADSIVSAITLAYFYHVTKQSDSLVVPVVCIPTEDVELRRDAAVLLQKAGIDIRDVLTLSDLAAITDGFTSNERVRAVTLVDHNKLTPQLHALLGHLVGEIYDHHEDCHEYTWTPSEKRHVAFQAACESSPGRALVASTCTLVAEQFSAKAPQALSADVALALLGVVLLDSINMDPAAGKVTDKDVAAVEVLGGRVPVNRSELFEELNGTKSDPSFWNSLSVTNCLRIDCKQFVAGGKKIAMSAVLMPIQHFTTKELFDDAVDQWMEQCHADLVVVLTLTTQPVLKRQLCCIARENDVLDGLARYLETSAAASSLQLQHTERKYCPHHGILIYEQANSKPSRKQVAPIVLQYFEEQLAQSH